MQGTTNQSLCMFCLCFMGFSWLRRIKRVMRVLVKVVIYVRRTAKNLRVRSFQIEGHDIPLVLSCVEDK